MNKKRIFIRLLASPLILCILIISYSHGLILHFIRYIRYGGEWTTYSEGDPKRLEDIFKLLKEQKIDNN